MRYCLPAMLVAFLFGCSADPPPPVREDSYRTTGELRVATRLDALSYRVDEVSGRANGYEHDLLVALGARLGVPVRFEVYPDALQALDAVVQGKAHLAAAGLSPNERLPLRWSPPLREVDYVVVARDDGRAIPDEGDLAGRIVGVRRGSPPAEALEAIQHRIADLKVLHPKGGSDAHLLEMVAKGDLDLAATDRVQYALAANLSRIHERLPPFRRHFQDAQALTGIDWRLLAALAYQESKWDPLATSPTGVRGMMMLTADTADRLGVDDRLSARASIIGGARYFALLRDQLPEDVPDPDRNWMAVAAYNLGMGHFNGARQIAASLKRDTRAWLDIKEVLPLLSRPAYAGRLKSGAARGGEAVTTAENVRTYYEILSRFEPPYLAPLEPARFKLPPARLRARPKPAPRVAEAPPEQANAGAPTLHAQAGDGAAR